MILKILGAIDLISGLILILLGSGTAFPGKVLMFLGMLLLLKSSFGMLKDFASWIDFIGGLIFLVSNIFEVPGIITIIVGLFVAQKGIFSFL
jgi:hypothetical protein